MCLLAIRDVRSRSLLHGTGSPERGYRTDATRTCANDRHSTEFVTRLWPSAISETTKAATTEVAAAFAIVSDD
ncbi:hypothetical protein AWB96_04360 [Mycobacteroides chelonae]|nr:hypothetical protein AWB96_04360 [Mycobacteroides chelonae]